MFLFRLTALHYTERTLYNVIIPFRMQFNLISLPEHERILLDHYNFPFLLFNCGTKRSRQSNTLYIVLECQYVSIVYIWKASGKEIKRPHSFFITLVNELKVKTIFFRFEEEITPL